MFPGISSPEGSFAGRRKSAAPLISVVMRQETVVTLDIPFVIYT